MLRAGKPCKHIVWACDVANIDVNTLLYPSRQIQNLFDLYARTFKISITGILDKFKNVRDENLRMDPMIKRPYRWPKMNPENTFY